MASGQSLVLYPSVGLRHGGLETPQEPRPGEEPATPLSEARRFREAGAAWMHVTDVDAALGERNQWIQLSRLLDGSLHIQFGGGVRSMTQVQQLLDLGVDRVVVGTQAVRNPLWARELGHLFPGRVVLALDCRGRELVVQGRREETGLDVVETARSLDDARLAGFLYSDVGGRPDTALVAELRLAAPLTPLLVGGDLTLDDLGSLDAAGVAGAVLAPGGAAEDLEEAVRRYPPPARPLLQVVRGHEELAGGEEE